MSRPEIDRANQEAFNLIAALNSAHAKRPITLLVHGNARGADKAAGEWARVRGITVREYAVDETLDGPWPAAGVRRNERMLADSNPDGCTAFPGGAGTADMVRRCTAIGVPVWKPYG